MSASSDEDEACKCIRCAKLIVNQNTIGCDECEGWLHLRCAGLKLKEFNRLSADKTSKFTCRYCKFYKCGKCTTVSLFTLSISMRLNVMFLTVINGIIYVVVPSPKKNILIKIHVCTPTPGSVLIATLPLLLIYVLLNSQKQ